MGISPYGLLIVVALCLNQVTAACDMHNFTWGMSCKCTASSCDGLALDALDQVNEDTAVIYTSSKSGLRLEPSTLQAQNSSDLDLTLALEVETFAAQQMIGFGGAFTDAAAYVLSLVSNETRDNVISAYFSRTDGARYTVGRVPIGSSDFSRYSYSLMESEDSEFKLRDDRGIAGEDYKLEMILDAMQEIEDTVTANTSAWSKLNVFGSPWSAPPFWKSCTSAEGAWTCGSNDYPQYTHQSGSLSPNASAREGYANYFVNFVSAYAKAGAQLWGITAQNEPLNQPTWENTLYTPGDLANFTNLYLGPAMRKAFPDLKIMNGDDQYEELEAYAALADASDYIDGLGIHWYSSFEATIEDSIVISPRDLTSPSSIATGGAAAVKDIAHKYEMTNRNGRKFLLATEACSGAFDNKANPGSWERGFSYLRDILYQTINGASGWTDWNLVLDLQGGPNHAFNFVDAPILVDTDNDVFYKNPMYYALAHYSAFIPPGAVRSNIVDASTLLSSNIETVGFRTEDDRCIVIVANDRRQEFALPLITGDIGTQNVRLRTDDGRYFEVEIGPYEWKTIVFECDNSFIDFNTTSA